jgi:protein-disulfide isomerase
MVRLRTAFDVIATALVATAAGVLLWRTTGTEQSRGGEPPPQVEHLDADNLYTDVAEAATKGDPMAAVVLIEYADFQCPFCKRFAQETFAQIDQRFVSSGLVQYAFRNYPLEKIHPAAMEAARAAQCASRSGRFWEMREELFANQQDLASIGWLEVASRLGIDERGFEQCLSDARPRGFSIGKWLTQESLVCHQRLRS